VLGHLGETAGRRRAAALKHSHFRVLIETPTKAIVAHTNRCASPWRQAQYRIIARLRSCEVVALQREGSPTQNDLLKAMQRAQVNEKHSGDAWIGSILLVKLDTRQPAEQCRYMMLLPRCSSCIISLWSADSQLQAFVEGQPSSRAQAPPRLG
jgi:hypothetical protein